MQFVDVTFPLSHQPPVAIGVAIYLTTEGIIMPSPYPHSISDHGTIAMQSMFKKLLPLLVLGAIGSSVFSAEKTPVVAVPPASGTAAATDLTASYLAIAVAKAKTEASLSALTQLIDSRTNGMNDMRGQIDLSRQKALSTYDTLRDEEEAKESQKNSSFIASCQAAHTKLETASNQSNQERSLLDQKLSISAEQIGALRNVYNSAENLERSLKEAHLDLSAVERVYSDVEYKTKAIEVVVKESMSAYAVVNKTWATLKKEAETFNK